MARRLDASHWQRKQNPNQKDYTMAETETIEREPEPSIEQLEEWMNEGGCEATDGCWVEPDGTCEHGCKSWALEMGLI